MPERQEIVDVRCLDNVYVDLAAKYGIERPYLKIDTQGYDLNVLKGGSRCLSSFVALQTEPSVLPLYKGMPDYREVIDYANRVGFELSGVFPVETDERMRLIEFDCVMISSTRAVLNPAPWR